jgi:hypothetical protein
MSALLQGVSSSQFQAQQNWGRTAVKLDFAGPEVGLDSIQCGPGLSQGVRAT